MSVAALATPIPGNRQKSSAVRISNSVGSSLTDFMICLHKSSTDNSDEPVHYRIAENDLVYIMERHDEIFLPHH
jgi:hypothetical protein